MNQFKTFFSILSCDDPLIKYLVTEFLPQQCSKLLDILEAMRDASTFAQQGMELCRIVSDGQARPRELAISLRSLLELSSNASRRASAMNDYFETIRRCIIVCSPSSHLLHVQR
jgi:hypothetical protein